MKRRSLLTLFAAPLITADTKEPINGTELTKETKAWFESGLVIESNKDDDSDWSEILARLAYSLLGIPLPEKVRFRTIARANSRSPSRSGFFTDTHVYKRIMCVLIVKLDDKALASRV